MSVPRGYALKTGAGRTTTGAPKVPSVETQPRPERDGNHWLINDRDGTTRCRGCSVTWASLGAEIRASVGRTS